ncbi:integrase core domain-containing protein [Pandoraea bronchicola]|uniref:integrase core domain-containing protein n=1 Tax=Pandoraea bronchicola TaxID=2508287 RepID=UPI001240D1E6
MGEFSEAVLGRGVRLSMDRKGGWPDNVFVERVWRSIKSEDVYLNADDSVAPARRSMGEYIDRHKRKRPHSSLSDQTPEAPLRCGGADTSC